MTDRPPLPQEIWETLSPEAQAAVSALVASLEQRIAALEERLNTNSTNSSKPPSSDPPSVKRRPPAPPSGKKRGGQPGHRRRVRPLVPPEQLRQVVECKPPHCRGCGHDLHGDDPEPLRHQVAEVPPVRPVVDEYRLHRLTCPRCGTTHLCGPCRRACPPGRSAPGCGPSSASWPGPIASASGPSGNWCSTCWACRSPLGMIARLERQGAAELEAPVEELREHVRDAASAHIDETSWWQGRVKAWLWAAVTDLVTVFTIATSRGAEVAKDMLGTAAAQGGHQRSAQELLVGQAPPVLLGASATGTSRR